MLSFPEVFALPESPRRERAGARGRTAERAETPGENQTAEGPWQKVKVLDHFPHRFPRGV